MKKLSFVDDEKPHGKKPSSRRGKKKIKEGREEVVLINTPKDNFLHLNQVR